VPNPAATNSRPILAFGREGSATTAATTIPAASCAMVTKANGACGESVARIGRTRHDDLMKEAEVEAAFVAYLV